MNLGMVLAILVWGMGAILFYFSYFISKKEYERQVSLYEDGIPVDVINAQELYAKILGTGLFPPDRVQIVDDESVLVRSGKYDFNFNIQNNILKYDYPKDISIGWTSIHFVLKEIILANQIQDAIAGTLNRNNVKGNKKIYDAAVKGMKSFRIAVVAIAIGGIVLVFGMNQAIDADYISVVKNCTVDGVEGTIGEHVDGFLANEKWDYFTSDDGDCMVEVSGQYGNHEILIQFRFEVSSSDSITSSSQFRLYYMGIDGMACSSDEAQTFFTEYIMAE